MMMQMPRDMAPTRMASGTRFILFASCVMVIADVNRAVRAGIIADGLRNVFELVDGVEAPAAILAEGGRAENQESIKNVEFPEHYSSSPELPDILDNCMGG